uniref:Uncharacterized protein n=1 Tax=Meloidogyne enterolobii TaxID=390850 RepID=A0A6V7UJ41_MELEN|nr:unnamed protein product [Meloidogyne enterolobii]
MKIKRKNLTKSLILHLVFTFLLSKFCDLIIWDFQYLSIEAAIIPSNNIQTTKLPQLDLRENDEQENQPTPIVERIEIRLIDNKENGSNEKQLMIVDVVKKQGLVAATIQQQNEVMDKQNTKPWFLVRIRQPYYHSKISEPFDQKNETSENEINNNLINNVEENNETVEIEDEMLNDNLLKNDSREEDKDYLEDERNRTMVFDDREECLLNKANLEKKIIQRLVNERRRIVRTIKKINRNQSQLCRMDRRRDQEKVLYRKCPMWRREKFFLYYALMRITYCGNHARWPGGIYYNEY